MGFRNISVLRTAGATKRKFINPDFSLPKGARGNPAVDAPRHESIEDGRPGRAAVPLSQQDLFPKEDPPAKAVRQLFAQLPGSVAKFEKVYHDDWVLKIVRKLCRGDLVRHGIHARGGRRARARATSAKS